MRRYEVLRFADQLVLVVCRVMARFLKPEVF